jgi:hypothetical protein
MNATDNNAAPKRDNQIKSHLPFMCWKLWKKQLSKLRAQNFGCIKAHLHSWCRTTQCFWADWDQYDTAATTGTKEQGQRSCEICGGQRRTEAGFFGVISDATHSTDSSQSWNGTIGQKVAYIPSRLSLTPPPAPRNIKQPWKGTRLSCL